jgi:hypothetical protein
MLQLTAGDHHILYRHHRPNSSHYRMSIASLAHHIPISKRHFSIITNNNNNYLTANLWSKQSGFEHINSSWPFRWTSMPIGRRLSPQKSPITAWNATIKYNADWISTRCRRFISPRESGLKWWLDLRWEKKHTTFKKLSFSYLFEISIFSEHRNFWTP